MYVRSSQRPGAKQKSGLLTLCWLVGLAIPFGAEADDVVTSFEFNATGPFTVGASPISATFSSGVAEKRGITQLYVSGIFSWHIAANDTATVTFETPSSELAFFVRTENANVIGEIRVFDENMTQIL